MEQEVELNKQQAALQADLKLLASKHEVVEAEADLKAMNEVLEEGFGSGHRGFTRPYISSLYKEDLTRTLLTRVNLCIYSKFHLVRYLLVNPSS